MIRQMSAALPRPLACPRQISPLYQVFAQPTVRALMNAQSAELLSRLHPLRCNTSCSPTKIR